MIIIIIIIIIIINQWCLLCLFGHSAAASLRWNCLQTRSSRKFMSRLQQATSSGQSAVSFSVGPAYGGYHMGSFEFASVTNAKSNIALIRAFGHLAISLWSSMSLRRHGRPAPHIWLLCYGQSCQTRFLLRTASRYLTSEVGFLQRIELFAQTRHSYGNFFTEFWNYIRLLLFSV